MASPIPTPEAQLAAAGVPSNRCRSGPAHEPIQQPLRNQVDKPENWVRKPIFYNLSKPNTWPARTRGVKGRVKGQGGDGRRKMIKSQPPMMGAWLLAICLTPLALAAD